MNTAIDEIRKQVFDKVANKLWWQVGVNTWNPANVGIGGELWTYLWNRINNRVYWQVKNQVGNQSLDNLKEKIKGEIQSRLSHLTGFLNGTDYQVIKCYEAQLLNEEMPYSVEEILAQRKAWRDDTNALEFEIAMLG
jgi:hypothetical protein